MPGEGRIRYEFTIQDQRRCLEAADIITDLGSKYVCFRAYQDPEVPGRRTRRLKNLALDVW